MGTIRKPCPHWTTDLILGQKPKAIFDPQKSLIQLCPDWQRIRVRVSHISWTYNSHGLTVKRRRHCATVRTLELYCYHVRSYALSTCRVTLLWGFMGDRGALEHSPIWGSPRASGGSLPRPRRVLVRRLGLPTERGPASVHEPAHARCSGQDPTGPLEAGRAFGGCSIHGLAAHGSCRKAPSVYGLAAHGSCRKAHQPARETLHLLYLVQFMDLLNGCSPDALVRNAFVIVAQIASIMLPQ